MSFDDFRRQAWRDHNDDAAGVAKRWPEGMSLVETEAQIAPFVALIAHVMGEHLARWDEGVDALQDLRGLRAYAQDGESEKAIARSIAWLKLGGGDERALDALSLSDQVYALCFLASAMNWQAQTERAEKHFRAALEKARPGFAKGDGANRALALAGNNIAFGLEQKPDRSPYQTELMVLAAETGLKYWEAPEDILMGEYRLAMSYTQAGRLDDALAHAKAHNKDAENAGPLEQFYGCQVRATVEHARKDAAELEKAQGRARKVFQELSNHEKAQNRDALEKLLALN